MLGQHVFIWNARGLNSWARRDVVREFLQQERASVVCLVETKIDVLWPHMVSRSNELKHWLCVFASKCASGGIIIAWSRTSWSATTQTCRRFSVTVGLLSGETAASPWLLGIVYGPVDENLAGGPICLTESEGAPVHYRRQCATDTCVTRFHVPPCQWFSAIYCQLYRY